MNSDDACHNWEMPSPRAVLDAVEAWKNLDLLNETDATLDRLAVEMRDRIGRFATSNIETSFLGLWRAHRYTDDRDWSRPASLLHPRGPDARLNRCNHDGTEVLYCSRRGEVVFDELKFQAGQSFVLVKLRTSKVRVGKVVGEFNPTDIKGVPFFKGDNLISYQILREFIRSEFTRPVGVGTEYLYRISAVIAKCWLLPNDGHGWIYPSLRSTGGENIALTGEAVDRFVQIVEAYRGVIRNMSVAEWREGLKLRGIDLQLSHVGKLCGDEIRWEANSGRQVFFRLTEAMSGTIDA